MGCGRIKTDADGVHVRGAIYRRGPCPGLNALANHGYLPRNGVTGLAESVRVVNDIFGTSVLIIPQPAEY